MDGYDIMDLADYAARSVRKRFSLRWSREDWQDARQEAAAGIVRALRDAPAAIRADPTANEGYFMRAGQQAATRFAFRRTSIHAWSLTHPDGSTCDDGQPIEARGGPSHPRSAAGWNRPIDDAELPKVWRLFFESRSKKGDRGVAAADRDTAILMLVSRGWTQGMIGEALGLPSNHVHIYWSAIRRRLARIAGDIEQQKENGGVTC